MKTATTMDRLNKVLLEIYKSALKDNDEVMIEKCEREILEAMK